AVLRRIAVRRRRDEERRPKQRTGGRASRQHGATGRRVREGASKAFRSAAVADQRRSRVRARNPGRAQTMKTLCRRGTVSPFFSGEHGKCRATKTNNTNRYEQTENLSATERQRQCRARRPAHVPHKPGSGCED